MTPRILLTVALLTLANVFNYMDRMLVAIAGPQIKYDLGLSDTEFGLLTGPAFGLSYAAASVFLGFLADTYSRRAIMTAGLAFWSAMTFASGYTSNFMQLSLARAGYGLGASGFYPAAFSYWGDYAIPPNRRAMVFGLFHTGSMLGLLSAFVVGGWIGAHYGWRMSFIATGAAGMCFAATLPFLIPEPPRGGIADPAEIKLRPGETLAILWKNKPYVWITTAAAIGNFANVGIIPWLPLFFVRSHHLNSSDLTFIFGPAIALGMIAGMLSGGWVSDRLARGGYTRPLVLCVWANVVLTALYWVVLTIPFAYASVGLIVVAAGLSVLYIPAYNAMMQQVLDSRVRATALAVLVFLANGFGLGVLPVIVGGLSDWLSLSLGDDGLRYALMIVITGNLLTALSFEKARRCIAR